VPARANAQVAFDQYLWDPARELFAEHGILVLTFRGEQILELTAFLKSES
jgi:hypothetical protein